MNIAEGEYICIIGETGSGKSTSLNIILGLLSPGIKEEFTTKIII